MVQPYYLTRMIYLPRVVAYWLASLVTFSQGLESVALPAWLLLVSLWVYPHVAYRVASGKPGSPIAAVNSLQLDAVFVGLLVIANDFHVFAATSFIAALTMSSLLIGTMPALCRQLLIVCLVMCFGYWFTDTRDSKILSADLQDWASALAVIVYGALVAGLGYRVTRHLGQARKQLVVHQTRIERLARRLGRYISPQVYVSLVANEEEATTRKCLTICFSDMEGFTTLMDSLPEDTVGLLLNEYLDTMAGIALEFGGTIDKFMGDGMMVFFGDPLTQGRQADALACVRMALAMQDRLLLLRADWQAQGFFSDIHMRIGINTGDCAVGNFGTAQCMDYTAIGSVVNIASRLEGRAAQDGILISAATFDQVQHLIDCQARSAIRLKGIQRAVHAYTVVAHSALTVAADG
jgi:class 3 adenylate cyclase